MNALVIYWHVWCIEIYYRLYCISAAGKPLGITRKKNLALYPVYLQNEYRYSVAKYMNVYEYLKIQESISVYPLSCIYVNFMYTLNVDDIKLRKTALK